MTDLTHYIGGKPVSGASGRFADVFNPATGASETRVPLATTGEVDAVVAAAKAAWPAWAKTPPLRRARILDRFKFLLQENADRLAEQQFHAQALRMRLRNQLQQPLLPGGSRQCP